jgi:alkylation response protein AidB-like acyl-CoA dehydrogenase
MGVEIAKKEAKVGSARAKHLRTARLIVQLGIRASSTCVLSFDDVKVPKENIVGEIGKGYKVSASALWMPHQG